MTGGQSQWFQRIFHAYHMFLSHIPSDPRLQRAAIELQLEWGCRRKTNSRKLPWRSHMARPKCRNSKNSSWFQGIDSWAWSVSTCPPGWAPPSTWAWTPAKRLHHPARRRKMISARILLQAPATHLLRCPSSPTSAAWTLQDWTWCWKSVPSSHGSKWPKSLNARCSQRLPGSWINWVKPCKSSGRKSHKIAPCVHGFKKNWQNPRTRAPELARVIGFAIFRIVRF